MKTVKSRKGSPGNNRKGVPRNVDEYLARVPEPARSTLNRIRAVIRSAVPPAATETISYGMPAFRYEDVFFYVASRHGSQWLIEDGRAHFASAPANSMTSRN